MAMTEVGGLYGGERADAFGYRWGRGAFSIVVESKVSRSDFLADRNKPHRNGTVAGMGDFRYYICPEGLIEISDLPHGWGLLWVNSRGHVKPKAGHICCHITAGYGLHRDLAEAWRHQADQRFELDMLVHALVRFGDPEESKERSREANRLVSQMQTKLNKLQERADRNGMARWELERYKEKFGEL